LIEVTLLASTLAQRVSEACADEDLRRLCLALAQRYSGNAARLQRQLLWEGV
jgi:hypothetical protein